MLKITLTMGYPYPYMIDDSFADDVANFAQDLAYDFDCLSYEMKHEVTFQFASQAEYDRVAKDLGWKPYDAKALILSADHDTEDGYAGRHSFVTTLPYRLHENAEADKTSFCGIYIRAA